MPEIVPLQVKGKFGALKGEVSSLFQPIHGSLEASELADITKEAIMQRISKR
jgi:hypothetical protein